jgi:3-methyladenine DNA glycosylase AlkD
MPTKPSIKYNLADLMAEMERLGTEKNRQIYARHGACPNQFGVSWADLNRLQKEIKRDQPLAEALWETGNNDAQCLAALIADPNQIAETTLDRWIDEATYYIPVNTIARSLACKTPFALQSALKWIESPRELISSGGWAVVVSLAEEPPNKGGAPDEALKPLIDRIEAGIHQAPNRTKEAMNLALIAIGGYRKSLQEQVLAAAKRIGKVDVDHGDTSCKTPDAVEYIGKMAARGKGF